MIKQALPSQITSYDVLKTLAVLLMVIDHIGHYFFPDYLWLRVAGRLCVPMWFFLIGYANSRDLSMTLWLGAAVLVVMSAVVGMSVFPTNILATILVVRLILDPTIKLFERSSAWRYGLAALLVFMKFPTAMFLDYGTSALILAMYGYYLRHGRSTKFINGFTIFTLMTFLISQQIYSGFSLAQFSVLGAGLFLVIFGLQFFKPCELPDLSKRATAFGCSLLKLCGRYSLEIYVVHLIAFKLIAVSLGLEGFGWFNFTIFTVCAW